MRNDNGDNYSASKLIGGLMLAVVVFMGGIFILLWDGPAIELALILLFIVGVPGFIFLKIFLGERRAELLSERGRYRAAWVERADTEPDNKGYFTLVFRFEDDGELLEHRTHQKLKKLYVGKRLVILSDPFDAKNYRVIMDTLDDRDAIAAMLDRQAAADGVEEEYSGPLNDAMLLQEKREAKIAKSRGESKRSSAARGRSSGKKKKSSKGKKKK